ncbi:hypothetical protein EDD11_009337, partial [Mortierella claussenii]
MTTLSLPATCFDPDEPPPQEGAGLSAGSLDLDPSVPSDSLAPTPAPLTKSKIRRLRKKQVRLCHFTVDEAKTTLLTFRGSINGRPAHILIDGGAE